MIGRRDYLITLAINRDALKFDWLKTERTGNKCYGNKFVHWSRNMQIFDLFRVSGDMSTNQSRTYNVPLQSPTD